MVPRTIMAFGFVVLLLLSAALLGVAQPRSTSAAATGMVFATIDDVDSGQPLSNAHLKVQLFRLEPGDRKFLSPLLCIPGKSARPRFTFAITTGPNGSFTLTAPAGGYIAKLTIPQRKPIFGCILFYTEAQIHSCSGVPTSRPAPHQPLYIRSTNSIPGFSGDMVNRGICAQVMPSPCEWLQVPNLVTTQKIVLLDFQGNPMRDAHLEFREYHRTLEKIFASLKTESNGVADVFSLPGWARFQLKRTLLMSVNSEPSKPPFGYLIQFTKDATPGQQTIKLFHWRCRGQAMQEVMVLP
jgi:hypothetical protein